MKSLKKKFGAFYFRFLILPLKKVLLDPVLQQKASLLIFTKDALGSV